MLSNQKYLVEKILEPILRPLSKVNPNILTLLGIIPSILFFVFMINHLYILAIISYLGSIFDLLDGMVARKYNKVTRFGGFLDPTFDRISDFLIIAAFAFAGIARWEIIAPLLLLSFLISYIRARGEPAGTNISFAIGPIERTGRLAATATALLLYIAYPTISIVDYNLAEIIFVVLSALSFYTAFKRLSYGYKKL